VKAREILRKLVRRFGLLLLLTLIGGTAGAVYGAVKTPTYTAKAYVVAIGDAGDSITALNFAQAYGRVATTGPVLAKAGTLLGADRTGLDAVTAATSPDAPVVEVTATGTSAVHTANVANAVANALADYGSSRKAETHVGLALLAGATTPAKPSSPKPPMELLVGAAGGLLIGGLAVLAGVGRAAVKERAAEPESEPARYTVAEVSEIDEEQPESRAEIERYMGVWRTKYGPKAITAYRSAASIVPRQNAEPADDEDEDEDDDEDWGEAVNGSVNAPVKTPVDAPINGSVYRRRPIGRATVSGTEEDD
jgi:capsular polysaccharide biosynthesis protein